MKFAPLAAIATLAGMALGDAAAIVSTLDKISADSLALNTSVASWSGDLFGVADIVVKSLALLGDINNATWTAKKSANLTDLDAFSIGVQTLTLITNTNSTVATIIAAKPKFDRLLIDPIISLNLQADKDATDQFGAALESKLPSDVVSLAASLIGEIDDIFDSAISAFQWSL